MIKKTLLVLLAGIVTSLFFFPVLFTFFPVSNTKNLMGALGWLLLGINIVKRRELSMSLRLLVLLMLSGLVSLMAYSSTIVNNTTDFAYATFIVTTAIWMGAAYTVCRVIIFVHGKCDYRLLVTYLTGVCVFQCIIALMIDGMPAVQAFVDRWVQQGQDFLHKTHRLYGVGASLDTAGSRFAACLVLMFGLLRNDYHDGWKGRQWYLLISMMIIIIVGNMIARTTIVGVIVGLAYFIITSDMWKLSVSDQSQGIMGKIFVGLLLFIPLSVFLYRVSPMFHRLFRFGFEGFFSLVEEGSWDVRSNTALGSMVVFPEELRTWLIGDGYFDSPLGDINYLGDLSVEGFYMGTDIGYLRFIFYFGLLGLGALIAYMSWAALMCGKSYPGYRRIFLFVLIVGFVVWMKIATDLFLVFALFICAGLMEGDEDEDDEEEEAVAETLETESA